MANVAGVVVATGALIFGYSMRWLALFVAVSLVTQFVLFTMSSRKAVSDYEDGRNPPPPSDARAPDHR